MVKDHLDYDVGRMVYISVMTLASGERKQENKEKKTKLCLFLFRTFITDAWK